MPRIISLSAASKASSTCFASSANAWSNLITASIRKPHTVLDAALKRTDALFLKTKAGTIVALARLFALLAGFVSASLRLRQVVLGGSNVPTLVILIPIRRSRHRALVDILRQCSLHRNQEPT